MDDGPHALFGVQVTWVSVVQNHRHGGDVF